MKVFSNFEFFPIGRYFRSKIALWAKRFVTTPVKKLPLLFIQRVKRANKKNNPQEIFSV